MTWLAIDTRSATEAMLSMPRVPPTGASGIGNWLLQARRAARLDHPDIAPVAECGVHEHWPFVAVDRRAGVTLDEWLAQHPASGVEDAAFWIASVLRGLAFAHDAGIAHLDLQGHNVLVNERGQACVMALSVAPDGGHEAAARAGRARQRRPPGTGRALGTARASRRRRARRPCLRRPAARPAHRRGGPRQRRHRPGPDADRAATDASTSACPGRRRSRFPSPCARSPTGARRARCDCAIATRAPSSARSPAGARPRPRTTPARSRSCSIGCAASATCRRCRASPGACNASPRSRASAPTRSRATSCPTWRSRSSSCARSARRGSRERRSPATARC